MAAAALLAAAHAVASHLAAHAALRLPEPLQLLGAVQDGLLHLLLLLVFGLRARGRRGTAASLGVALALGVLRLLLHAWVRRLASRLRRPARRLGLCGASKLRAR